MKYLTSGFEELLHVAKEKGELSLGDLDAPSKASVFDMFFISALLNGFLRPARVLSMTHPQAFYEYSFGDIRW